MAGHGDKMERLQEQAIAALLAQPTVKAAAEIAGIDYTTLKRWLTQPAFASAYRQARTAIVEEAIARLQRACDKAVAALERNLECGNPVAENAAAKLILEQSMKGVETLDLMAQVQELTQRLAEVQDGERGAESGAPEAPVPGSDAGSGAGNQPDAAGHPPGPSANYDAGKNAPRSLATGDTLQPLFANPDAR